MIAHELAASSMDMSEKKKRGLWKFVVLGVSVAGLFAGARLLDVGSHIEGLQAWLTGLGPWGYLAFLGIYVVAVVAMLPGSAISIAAGALYGATTGVILVSVGATVGASLAFLISRHIARKSVEQWLAGNERFTRLDRMTEKHGPIIVGLTRLVPLFPFNLLNYGFGLTRVPFGTYVFWSWLCMLPGTFLYVAGADAVTTAIRDGRIPWVLVAVVAVALIIVTLLVRQARRRLGAGTSGE